MKRADGLYDITRRQFVALAGAAGVGAALAGCGSDPGSSTPDAPTAGPDAPAGGACAAGATDAGAPATFVSGKAVLVANKFFVVRDAGGLFAMSAACTHEGAITCIGTTNGCSTSGTEIFCPRHGAVFKFDGTVVRGPASVALPHFAMCLLPNGHVGVETTMVVSASTRLSA